MRCPPNLDLMQTSIHSLRIIFQCFFKNVTNVTVFNIKSPNFWHLLTLTYFSMSDAYRVLNVKFPIAWFLRKNREKGLLKSYLISMYFKNSKHYSI